MNIRMKFLASTGWIVVFAIGCVLLQLLRHIGTDWMNVAGFLRVVVLGILLMSLIVPLVFAVLTWFNYPKRLYKKLR